MTATTMKRRVILTRPTAVRTAYTVKTGNSTSPSSVNTAHPRSLSKRDVGVCVPKTGDRASVRDTTTLSVLDDLMERVKALPAADKKTLLDRVAADRLLTEPNTESDREVAQWATSVHQAITSASGGLAAAGVGVQVVRKIVAASAAFAPVRAFVAKAGVHDLQVNERQAVYNMLADLLVKHAQQVARRSGAPFSAKLVANCTGNLAGVFDRAFPGYLEAGLVRVVARQIAHRRAFV